MKTRGTQDFRGEKEKDRRYDPEEGGRVEPFRKGVEGHLKSIHPIERKQRTNPYREKGKGGNPEEKGSKVGRTANALQGIGKEESRAFGTLHGKGKKTERNLSQKKRGQGEISTVRKKDGQIKKRKKKGKERSDITGKRSRS